MKKVEMNCKVHLLFDDGEGFYQISPFSLSQINGISVNSPIGKAIIGRSVGEEIEFFNARNEKVKVKILKIENSLNMHNAP